MHYTLDYGQYEDPAVKDSAALADCRNWLGADRFARIDTLYRGTDPLTLDEFRLHMSFVGIQGFPVEVWYRSLWPTTVEAAPAV